MCCFSQPATSVVKGMYDMRAYYPSQSVYGNPHALAPYCLSQISIEPFMIMLRSPYYGISTPPAKALVAAGPRTLRRLSRRVFNTLLYRCLYKRRVHGYIVHVLCPDRNGPRRTLCSCSFTATCSGQLVHLSTGGISHASTRSRRLLLRRYEPAILGGVLLESSVGVGCATVLGALLCVPFFFRFCSLGREARFVFLTCV